MSLTLPSKYETSYDPIEIAEQDVLRKAFAPEEANFWNMFSAKQDLTTDLGRQAWATSGLSGEALAKLPGHKQTDQRAWYVQRNAVDYGLNELNNVIEAYEELGNKRNFTQEEATQFEEVLERKKLLEGDLAFIHDSLEGNRDAPMFDNGNSFNDVWGTESGETAGISEVMDFAMENPAAMAGLLAGEIVKDVPISILSIFGLTSKIGKGVSIIDKVHKTMNRIKPKALKGLAYLGTGVVAGASAGAGYEYAYSKLEEGEAKPKHIEQGATFGGIFGLLGGIGLMSQGIKLRGTGIVDEAITGPIASAGKVVGKQTLESIKSDSAQNLKHLQKIADDMIKEADHKAISKQAERLSILNDRGYVQDVKYGKGGRVGEVAYTTIEPKTGKMTTFLDKKALEKEWLRIKTKFEKDGTIEGVSVKDLTPREIAILKNRDAYEALVLAKEKAKGVLTLDHIKASGSTQGIAPDLDTQAFKLAKDELDKLDAKTKQAPQDSPSDVNVKQTIEADKTNPEAEAPPPGFIVSTLEKHTGKSAVGLGAAGFGLSEYGSEGEGIYGLAAGAAVAFGGAKLSKVLGKSLNSTVLETKRAFSEQSADYGMMAKLTEYRMNNILERMDKVFINPKDKENLIESIETGKKLKDPAQEAIKKEIKMMLHILGKEAQDAGFIRAAGDVGKLKFGKFEKDKKGSYLYNYFPHIFKKEITDEFLEELLTKFGSTTTPAGNRRTMMGTLKEINKAYPDMNVILDPTVALAVYTKAMTKAVYGRRMVDSLRRYNLEFDTGRIPAMMTKEDLDALTSKKAELLSKKGKKEGKRGLSSEEAAHYEYFTHPSLKGYVAHNNVKNLIDGHFKTIRKGSAKDIAENALKFGNALKRISVFGSLFHAQALILSFSYVMGVTGAIKGIGGSKFKGKVGKGLKVEQPDGSMVDLDWSHLKLGTGMYQGIVEEAVSWKLGVGDTKSRQSLNPGMEEMDNFLDRLLGENSLPGKTFKMMDHITWDQLHDRFKVAAWLQQRHKLMERGISYEKASEMAAVFANDAFGGLDWDGFATRLYAFAQKNPHSIRGKIAPHIAAAMPANNRKWFNALLFAPDWTLSNIRIVGNLIPLTGRTIKAMKSEGFMKAFQKNPSMKSKEAKELLAAWKMYGAYTTRAGIQTTALWWLMSQANGWFSGPESPEPDFDEFMKFWLTGKLDLGGGETMVISKQIVEPIHWVTNFRHTLMNKGAILPKTAIEGMMNKQWFTLKGDNPYGPAISDKDGSHYFKWLGKKFVPIVASPLFDDSIDISERIERMGTGAVGFPQYQSKN